MKRILVIDDDEAVRASFELALADLPWTVISASSGEQGVALAAGVAFDLVFLDLRMPGIDGVETLRRLREHGCPAPVFVVTGFAGDYTRRLTIASRQGLDFELMRKPLERDDIRNITSTVLEPA